MFATGVKINTILNKSKRKKKDINIEKRSARKNKQMLIKHYTLKGKKYKMQIIFAQEKTNLHQVKIKQNIKQ